MLKNQAWDQFRAYAESLAQRTNTQTYETIDPCDSSEGSGTVQGIIKGSSKEDVVRQTVDLRRTLAREGWRLTSAHGALGEPGDFDGTRRFGAYEAWVFSGPSANPSGGTTGSGWTRLNTASSACSDELPAEVAVPDQGSAYGTLILIGPVEVDHDRDVSGTVFGPRQDFRDASASARADATSSSRKTT